MTSFVDRIAKTIVEERLPLAHLTIIVPSERMITYLHKALYKVDGQPKMAPRIVTIDRWMQQLVAEPVLDKTRLLFELYAIFRADPVEEQTTDFDTFLGWGQLLLSDFDEIDRYLVDPKQLFRNLRDVREIENWSFNQEELSKGQRQFMAFWDKLGPYYYALAERLKKRGQTTKGKVYRTVAENIDLAFAKDPQSQFVFAGFNALSIAELDIMKQLYVMGRARIFMDSDVFYLKDKYHEAGAFQRVLLEHLQVKELPFVGNQLLTKSCKIQAVACAQVTGQAKVIGTILAGMKPEQLNETLVLLADESLIVSLIQHLPKSIEKANITLGLPLRATSLRLWVDFMFRIQESLARRKRSTIYFKDVNQYLHHPFIQGFVTKEELRGIRKLEQDMVSRNRPFVEARELTISERFGKINQLLFTPWNNDWQLAMNSIRELNLLLDEQLDDKHMLEKAVIRSFNQALTGLHTLMTEERPAMQLGTFRNVFNQHWSTESMAYFGNPTEGLQVMGLLETRGLDFKHLLVLGLNEGTMPPTNPIQTLIPMDLRRFFKLPTPREKQGLFAHHFYRLLHAAETIDITYATAQDGIGSHEPSRFIQQLELELVRENPQIAVEHRYYTLGSEELISGNEVEKTPEVLNRLDEMLRDGITFSKLDAFVKCPLNFYYRYVLRIGEETKVQEEIESSTLGTVLHEVLENLLKPYEQLNDEYVRNNRIAPAVGVDDLKKMIDLAPLKVDDAFREHVSADPETYSTGTNHITYVMANEIIRKVLQREIAESEARPESTLHIYALEHDLTVETSFELGGKPRIAKINGVLDRIDQRDGRYRVIDYKSGGVKTDAVTIANSKKEAIDAIIDQVYKPEKTHILQLLIYCYLFEHGFGKSLDQVGIFSFINTSESPFYLGFKGEGSLNDAASLAEEVIRYILEDMYDTREPFRHNPDAKYCLYC